MSLVWSMVAQVTSQPAAPPASNQLDQFLRSILPLILLFVVFYWVLFRNQRKERQKQVDMLRGLKRNDRVQTIGGIFGTIVDVRDNDVVLKVDESNNVKIRFNRSAIKEVLSSDAAPPPLTDASKK